MNNVEPVIKIMLASLVVMGKITEVEAHEALNRIILGLSHQPLDDLTFTSILARLR